MSRNSSIMLRKVLNVAKKHLYKGRRQVCVIVRVQKRHHTTLNRVLKGTTSLTPDQATATKNKKNKLIWIVDFPLAGAGNRYANYANNWLYETLNKKGFDAKIVSSDEIDITVENNINTSELPCLVLPRTGSETTFRDYSLYSLLECQGVPVVNNPLAINHCANKLLSYALLAHPNINVPVPKTCLIQNDLPVKEKIDIIQNKHGLKLPVIIKILDSTHGDGVFMAKDEQDLNQLLRTNTFFSKEHVTIVQECVMSSLGTDVRVWVAGDKVINCLGRKNENSFLSNISQGGVGFDLELNESAKQISVAASLALGLDYSGVDLLFDGEDENGEQKWKIAEVNSSPDWVPGFNDELIANSIIDYILGKYNLEP